MTPSPTEEAERLRNEIIGWDAGAAILRARIRKLERVVVVAKGMMPYNKALIPWTEWADLRAALAALEAPDEF